MRTRRSGKVAEADSSLGNLLDKLHEGENGDAKDDASASVGLTLDDVSRQDVEKLLGRVSERRGAAAKRRQAQEGNSGKRGTKRKPEVGGDEPLFGQRSASLSGSIYARAASVTDTSRCGTLAKTTLDEDVVPISQDNDQRSTKKVRRAADKLQRNNNVSAIQESTPTQYTTDEEDEQDVVQGGAPGEDDEFDWEEGGIGLTSNVDFEQDNRKVWNGEVTLDMKGSPGKGLSKGAFQGKPSKRRATAKDKEFAEMVHKAHLLCLLARGRIVDAACDDPMLQASILSLLPPNLGLSVDAGIVNAKVLGGLVSWFMSSFRILSAGEGSSSSNQEDFSTRLPQSLQKQAGSSEEVTALSVAFLRALGLTTRYVMVLDVVPLKPDADSLEASEDWQSHSFEEGVKFSHHSDVETTKVASLARILARSAPLQLNGNDNQNEFLDGECGPRSSTPVKSPGRGRRLSNRGEEDSKSSLRGRGKGKRSGRGHGKTGLSSGSQEVNRAVDELDVEAPGSGLKTRADEEFERDLAMAIAATSAIAEVKDLETLAAETVASPLEPSLSAAKMLKGKGPGYSGTMSWRKKLGLIPKQEGGSKGATCSRKFGPMVHWAEVYCSGEGSERGWLHVDAARGIVDGADKLEAASRLPLRYVVAFAGRGAKDVTRRYVTSWSAISPLRVDESWWDGTLNPLKQLEAAASAGVTFSGLPAPHKSSLKAEHSQEQDTSSKDTNGLTIETENPSVSEGIPCSSSMNPSQNISEYKPMNTRAGQSPPKISPRQLRSSKVSAEDRSALEDMEMETKTFTEPLPTSQQAYKSHHLYALERWLTKYQTLHPKGPVLGYCAGHAVYPRTCVQILHTPDRWLREGFKVNDGESPAKVVKASRFAGKEVKSGNLDINGNEENSPAATTALYGKWQTDPWQPPAAVNGVVPKNERGQVDALSEKCIPPGTVHLRLPRLVPIANALGIDFAPAMVGFEIRKGRSFPVYEGIVVCEEFKDVILDAYEHQEEIRFHDLRKKREEHAVKRWRQLFQSMSTRQQLQAAYECSPSVDTNINLKGEILMSECELGIDNFSRVSADGGQQPSQNLKKKGVRNQTPNGARKLTPSLESEHVHHFPEESQSYDEESGIRMKQCACGFTFYVEEM